MAHPFFEYIKTIGAIRIDEFMRLALMHPEFGYYQTRNVFGAKGDFITAPEISQIFGELCGIWAADCWLKSDSPQATLMELGPGRGTLMKDALRATKSVAGFYEHISVWMVEASAKLQTLQRETLANSNVNIAWSESIENLPKTPLFVIANEFFDALPIRQFVKERGGWFERYVAWNERDAQLEFVLRDVEEQWSEDHSFIHPHPCPLPSRERELQSLPLPSRQRGVQSDEFYELCEEAQTIMKTLCEHIAKYGGAMLVIDYGYEGGSRMDTLQAVKSHAYADVLGSVGEADITAHVDFDALSAIAKGQGVMRNISPQGEFLLRMGAQLRAEKLCERADAAQQEIIISSLKRLVSPEQMGTLFKVLVCSHPSFFPAGFTS